MKFTVSLEKKYLVYLIISIAIVAGISYTIAQTVPNPGHIYTDIGFPEGVLVPSGAVMAFDLASCPPGWSLYAAANGKVIVGLSSSDSEFNSLGKTGGEKSHALSIAEMPSHTHNYIGGRGGPYSSYGAYSADPAAYMYTTYSTGARGGSGAHNNLQPYVTLIYCKKN